MKKTILFTALVFSLSLLNAQQNSIVKKGDVLTLNAPSNATYNHINFPKQSTLIKRSVVPNYNALIGQQLEVVKVNTNKNGNTIAQLKRKDGANFFRFYPKVTANIDRAISNGELSSNTSKTKQALAK